LKPFISLCMIVKNEENVLKRCLQSVEGILDEILILDTGSTDRTIEIASQYTDKIYQSLWTNDFSDARNYIASKASGEWIIALDADEYVDRENLKETISYLKSVPSDLYVFKTNIINFAGEHGDQLIQHQHNRIYKNIPSIKFHRKIHEQLMIKGNAINGAESPLNIYHSGYMKHVVIKKNKRSRNRELIEKELEMSENTAFDYFNLGNELNSIGDYQEALKCYQKAFNFKKDINYTWVPINVVQLIHCLIYLQRYNDALSVIEDAKNIWTGAIDFHYLQGHIYFLQHRYGDAKLILKKLLNQKGKYKTTLVSLNYKDIYPYNTLGKIAKFERDEQKAVEYFSKSLNINKYQQEILIVLLQILFDYHNDLEVEKYLNKLGLNKDNYQILNTIRILLKVPAPNIAINFSEYFGQDSVIRDGVAFKSELISGNASKVIPKIMSMSLHEVQLLLKQEIIDAYDLLIILLQAKEDDFELIKGKLIGNNDRFIVSILNGEKIKEEFIAEYIQLLDRCIQYKYFETFEQLLQIRDVTLISLTLSIGHLLYNNNFKELAIGFYQEISKVEEYDDEAFVNVVKEFIHQEEFEEALKFILGGIEQERKDFRIYKYGIELTDGNLLPELKEDLVNVALEFYPDSSLLMSYLPIKTENENNVLSSDLGIGWLNKKLKSAKSAKKQKLILGREKKNKIHIVYVMNHVRVCGGAKIIFEHTNRLKKLGMDVSIISHSPKPKWFPIDANYIEVAVDRDLVSEIPECDVIVATYWDHIQACIDSFIAPVVYLEQGDFHLFENENHLFPSDEHNSQFKDLIFSLYQLPEFIITVSQQTAKNIKEKFQREAAVIHNSIDNSIFNNRETNKRIDSGPYILMMGSDRAAFKGISDIKAAYEIIKREREDFKLYWITPTSPSMDYTNIADEIFINPNQQEIADLYRGASVYVSASHYESFSLPVLEAMACGCPVVTTGNEGVLEYAEDNFNALITKIRDPLDISEKILKVLNNHGLKNKLIINGLSTVEKFDWNNISSQLLNFYSGIALYKVDKVESIPEMMTGGGNMHGMYIGNDKMLIKTIWGGHLIVPSNDLSITPLLITSGIFERPLTNFLLTRVKAGNIVFDLGANTGYYTVLMGRLVGIEGKVFAYEPNPEMFAFLTDNVGTNYLHNQVILNNTAVYSMNTELTLNVSNKYTGHSSINKRNTDELKDFDNRFDTVSKEIKVKAETLDKFFYQYNNIDLVKIDIEGGEYNAFVGMKNLLLHSKINTIVFEWNQPALGEFVEPLIELMKEISVKTNMLFYYLNNDGVPIRTTLDEIKNVNFIHSVLLSKSID
jgi:FkbM family methyltransferase